MKMKLIQASQSGKPSSYGRIEVERAPRARIDKAIDDGDVRYVRNPELVGPAQCFGAHHRTAGQRGTRSAAAASSSKTPASYV